VIRSMTDLASDARSARVSGDRRGSLGERSILKVAFKIPQSLASREGELETLIRERLKRGSVSLSVYVSEQIRHDSRQSTSRPLCLQRLCSNDWACQRRSWGCSRACWMPAGPTNRGERMARHHRGRSRGSRPGRGDAGTGGRAIARSSWTSAIIWTLRGLRCHSGRRACPGISPKASHAVELLMDNGTAGVDPDLVARE